MKTQRGFTLIEGGGVFMLLVLAAGAIGWIMNIVKFVGLLGGDITTWFIARAVGIVLPPLGAILGFL